jgi:hypothetical protein
MAREVRDARRIYEKVSALIPTDLKETSDGT